MLSHHSAPSACMGHPTHGLTHDQFKHSLTWSSATKGKYPLLQTCDLRDLGCLKGKSHHYRLSWRWYWVLSQPFWCPLSQEPLPYWAADPCFPLASFCCWRTSRSPLYHPSKSSNIIPKSSQLSQNTKVDSSYPSLLPHILVQREQLRIGVSGAKSHTPFSDPRQGEALFILSSYSTALFLNYRVRLYCLILEVTLPISHFGIWPAILHSLTAVYSIKVRNIKLCFTISPNLICTLLK